ncbi:MAG: flagellar protein FlgN [Roseovarius sp.]
MTETDTAEIMSALDNLLEAERTALLEGDLDRIAELLDQKSCLIDALVEVPSEPREGFDGLRKKAMRNQQLLEGALEGIRRVAERLAALRRMRHAFDTYDDRGHKRTIQGSVVHKVEKRA